MATVSASTQEASVSNFASGSFTSDNTATVVQLGFTPRYVKVVNSTDVITWEKLEGMAAANSVKVVTAGTTTIDTGSAITFDYDAAAAKPGVTMTLSQTLVGNSKAISWVAFG
jgi:hypothetical protein